MLHLRPQLICQILDEFYSPFSDQDSLHAEDRDGGALTQRLDVSPSSRNYYNLDLSVFSRLPFKPI